MKKQKRFTVLLYNTQIFCIAYDILYVGVSVKRNILYLSMLFTLMIGMVGMAFITKIGLNLNAQKSDNVQKCEVISFKKLTPDDISLMIKWFEQPHVSKWWPILAKDEVIAHFLKRIRSKDTFGFIVYLGGKPIGYIQYYYIDAAGEKTGKYLPEFPAHTIGTDQFIGNPEYIGKGVGTQMVKAFIAYVQQLEPNTTTIIVDPEPVNHAAIRCYEKVGFKKVGTYETAYGACLLMRYDL